jgi:hypothetical protein
MSPTATSEVRGAKITVPQRGQALAVSAIMPPHFLHLVIPLIIDKLTPSIWDGQMAEAFRVFLGCLGDGE